jgi:hypothetical protein
LRRSALLLVSAAIVVLPPGLAWPCSMAHGPDIEWNAVLPPGAEFRTWWPYRSEGFRLELRDAADRVVPADVAAYPVPLKLMYRWPGHYIVLKPRQRLAPGAYRLGPTRARDGGLAIQDGTPFLVVDSGLPYLRPSAPGKLQARLLHEQCMVNTNADCSPMLGKCVFLVLDFDDPGKNDRSVYDVRWVPSVRGKADPGRAGGSPGYRSEAVAARRAIRIPIWVLDDLHASDTTVRIELRALDAEGNASPPATAEIDAAELRAAAQGLEPPEGVRAAARMAEPPKDLRLVDDRYTQDVARFARAAADPETAATLALLSGVSAPPGRRNDEAFERAVLSHPARVRIQGRLRGHESTTVTAWARVQNGRVRLLDADPLRAAIAQVPLDLPEIERGELRTFEYGSGQVQAELVLSGGDSVLGSWHKTLPTPNLRSEIDRKRATRTLVDGHPVFRALVAGYGRPRQRSAHSVWFGLDHFGSVQASFEIRERRVTTVQLSGPFAALRIVPFVSLLDSAVASAGGQPDPQQNPNVAMTIAEDGTVAGELSIGPHAVPFTQKVPFTGRIDLARLRPSIRSH